MDDVELARDVLRPYYALYVGGMGARGANFYNDLVASYGFEAEAKQIQDLFLDGKQRDAAAAVPDALVDELALVGPPDRIRDRLAAWKDSGATTLLISTRDSATLRVVSEALMNLFDLSGKTAIVTGGGKGIGRQMAQGLAEAGANVVLCARQADRCEQAAAELEQLGVKALGLGCDVRDPEQVAAVVERTVADFGPWTSSSTTPARSGALLRRHAARGLAEGRRRQPDRRLPLLAGGREDDDRRRRRIDRQHRLGCRACTGPRARSRTRSSTTQRREA